MKEIKNIMNKIKNFFKNNAMTIVGILSTIIAWVFVYTHTGSQWVEVSANQPNDLMFIGWTMTRYLIGPFLAPLAIFAAWMIGIAVKNSTKKTKKGETTVVSKTGSTEDKAWKKKIKQLLYSGAITSVIGYAATWLLK